MSYALYTAISIRPSLSFAADTNMLIFAVN